MRLKLFKTDKEVHTDNKLSKLSDKLPVMAEIW